MPATLLYVKVEGEPTEAEDRQVPGVYLIEVDETVPAERHASAALDIFHAHLTIGMLDDFTCAVFNQDGEQMAEPADAKDYQFKDNGGLVGVVAEADLPAAMRGISPDRTGPTT